MQTTNNLFRKVHNYTPILRDDLLSLNVNVISLEIFRYFQYFERFRWIKKWEISKPKIVDWYLDFSEESHTTLKGVISSFKICFQNYGQLKLKIFEAKKKSSTFVKFQPSSLSGRMLKTWKNTNKKSVSATVV